MTDTIQQIDTQIDANRRALMNRLHVNPGMSAFAWQKAWDRCPDLRLREQQLYRQRGIAQQARDAAEHKAWQTAQRVERATIARNRKLSCIDREAA